MKELHEYKGRQASKKISKPAKSNYFKKFLKQAIVSALIFSGIFSNIFFKNDYSAKIRDFAKTALEYNIDFSKISSVFKEILKNSIPTTSQGEVENENPSNPQKNL